jgi:hypothetical protein
MKKYKVTAGQTVLTKFQASSGKLQAASNLTRLPIYCRIKQKGL